MNTTNLMLSILFGVVGMGYLMYGKSMATLAPIGAGLGLMVVPYFVSNNILLVIVCLAMMAAPFVLRDR